MHVTIFHNPNCSTSRKVLGWLTEKGIEPEIVQYLKTPPNAAELKRILKLMGGAKAADILRHARAAERALIVDASVFDVYEGPGVEPGKKSVAISVTLQPRDKTLTDAEIDAVAAKIVAEVSGKTGATLRG